ncbi:MAG TPA: HAD family phosphatase [Pseudonocardia sp.]|jgi:HAD superfamily hydrolase (TIGR01509 family)|uniref:HAD family hydrolase n=1 Tax=Pseudonocardia sp. TaxID=60912 RepID=UPI002F41EEA0
MVARWFDAPGNRMVTGAPRERWGCPQIWYDMGTAPEEARYWRPVAVVFDCDGLLVDTEPCWTVAETELFARRGLSFGPEQKAMLIGRTIPAACADLTVLFDEPGRAPALEAELLGLVSDVLASSAQAMPGAHDVVAAAAARVPVAVASNSPRSLLDAALRRAGLVFPVSLCADDVIHAKPAPDMYLAACARLGVPARRCVAFEDSMTGLRSALAAGVPCVGVPSLPHVELPADLVLASLRDPFLIDWIRSW